MTATLAERRKLRERESLWVELEWRRVSRDFIYFLRTYVNVESKRDPRGWEEWAPLDYQIEFAEALISERYIVLLKARQLGASTVLMSYALWLMLTKPGGARVLAIADKGENANGLIQKLGVQYRLLPDWVKARGPKVTKKGTGHMVLEHLDGSESFIIAQPATETTGASNTADLVILDEYALSSFQDSTYKTIEPTTYAAAQNPANKGAVLVMCSTARGGHGLFAQTFRMAQRGENQFRALFFPWTVSPFVGQAEYDRVKKFWELKGEPWMLYSEMPASPEEAFAESGARRFPDLPPMDDVDEHPLRLAWNGTEWVPDPDGPLRLRTDPHPDAAYVLACDPATGVGGDYTSAQLGTVNADGDIDLVGYWHSNRIEPADVAVQLDHLGRWYCGRDRAALIVVESQGGYGATILNELNRHLRYPRIYAHVPPGARRARVSPTFGFPCHWTKRPTYVAKLAEVLASAARPESGGAGIVGLYPLLREELATFVVKPNGRVEADTGCHDDLVMSLVYLVWVLAEHGITAPRPIPREDSAHPEWGRATLTQLYDDLAAAGRRHATETAKFERELRRATTRRARTTRRR